MCVCVCVCTCMSLLASVSTSLCRCCGVFMWMICIDSSVMDEALNEGDETREGQTNRRIHVQE